MRCLGKAVQQDHRFPAAEEQVSKSGHPLANPPDLVEGSFDKGISHLSIPYDVQSARVLLAVRIDTVENIATDEASDAARRSIGRVQERIVPAP